MSLDERFQQAISDNDRSTANRVVDNLLQRVVEVIQSADRERDAEVDDMLTLAIGPWRRLLYSEEMDPSLLVGQLDALQGLLRALREDRPSNQDMQAIHAREHAAEFVLALYRSGALRAYQIMDRVGLRHHSTASDLGSYLENHGLVKRDRRGKGAVYWLTIKGNLVGRELERASHYRIHKTSAETEWLGKASTVWLAALYDWTSEKRHCVYVIDRGIEQKEDLGARLLTDTDYWKQGPREQSIERVMSKKQDPDVERMGWPVPRKVEEYAT